MTWRIHSSFVDLPCKQETGFFARFARPVCDGVDPTGTTDRIRDGITDLLAQRGIDYRPVGDHGDWLWCLGGPDLMRGSAHAEYAEQDMCVDLTVWLCARHDVICAEIHPFELAPHFVDVEPPHRVQSQAIDLEMDGDPSAAFLPHLEDWLASVLVLPR